MGKFRPKLGSIIIFLVAVAVFLEVWARITNATPVGNDRTLHPYIMTGGFDDGGFFNRIGNKNEQPSAFGYEEKGFFGIPTFKYGTKVRSISERGKFLYRDRAHLVDNEKKSDSIRIFILGGSVAFGEGASAPDQRWFILLEELLQQRSAKRIEVIPAANHTHVTSQERLIQDLYVLPFNPDVMIFLNGFNDANTGSGATRPGDPYGQGVMYLLHTSAIFNFMVDFSKHSAFVRYVMHRDLSSSWFSGPYDEETFQSQAESVASVYFDNLNRMRHRCEVEGKLCFFFLQPTWDLTLAKRQEKPLNRFDMVTRNYMQITGQLNDNKFVNDLTNVFNDKTESVHFYDPAHFNNRGHEIIAKAIALVIENDQKFKSLTGSRK